MQLIFDVLSLIGEALSAFFDFIVTFFKDIVFIVQICVKALEVIPTYFEWLPYEVYFFLSLCIFVLLTFKIVGR